MLSFRGGINLKDYGSLSALAGKSYLDLLAYLRSKYGGVTWLTPTSGVTMTAKNTALDVGRNVVINGDFASDTVWVKGTNWSISGGLAVAAAAPTGGTGNIEQQNILAVARQYKITYTISNYSAGTIRVLCGDAGPGTSRTANGTYTETLTCAGNGDLTFQVLSAFTGDIDDITVTQLDIEASTSYPGPELLTDGDMEAADTSAWTAVSDGQLSKVTSLPHGGARALRIATLDGDSTGGARQVVLTIGKRYRIRGFAHGDGGDGKPYVYDATFTTPLWVGTNSTSYQEFDFEWTATTAGILMAIVATSPSGSSYAEFDSVSVREVNPLNATLSGVTLGTTAPKLGNVMYFDGVNDYGNLYSAEFNSFFNPNAGTLLVWAKVASAGVWADGQYRRIVNIQADLNNRIYFEKDNNNYLEAHLNLGGTNQTIAKTDISSLDFFLVVMTWDTTADEFVFYINGLQHGSKLSGLGTWVGNFAASTACFGSQDTTPGLPWSGYLTTPVLLRGVMTPDEIRRLAIMTGCYDG